jgi:hypothetical protein
MRKALIPLLPVLLACSFALSACGGSAGATGSSDHGGSGTSTTAAGSGSATTSQGSGSTTSTTSVTSTKAPYGPSHVSPKSTTATSIPKEGPSAPVQQYVGAGQQVLIEPDGFWPQTLYANMAVAVVWTNETNASMKVILDYIPVESAEIPPGGQFIWSPHFGGSYTYRSSSGLDGRLILQQDTPVSPPSTTSTTTH